MELGIAEIVGIIRFLWQYLYLGENDSFIDTFKGDLTFRISSELMSTEQNIITE